MKFKKIAFTIVVGGFCGYLGIRLQKQIEKSLKRHETPDLRGGNDDRVGFWLKLLEKHKDNLPYVLAILGGVGATATFKYDELLVEFLSTTTFSSLYNKVKIDNRYIKALKQRQTANKFVEAHSLIEAFELTPKMSLKEKIDGYKLILIDLLSCDTKIKLIYNTIGLATLLIYLFTGNLLVFTNMIWALIQLVKEGKVSRAVAKALIVLLRKKCIPIPKELEDLINN